MKRLAALLCAVLLLAAVGCATEKTEEGLEKLVLNEVVHSVFYAPQYVAMELGFFEEEGIDLQVDVGNGADKSMTAVISGNADVALCGTEAAVYIHAEGREDVPVVFAQLTQRAGNFLVGRQEEPDFEWKDLIGQTIIGGREGGMPEMVLEYILKENGIDPEKDLTIITNLDLSATAGAFVAGTGAYTTEFAPGATTLEEGGNGYVVASLGVDSGYVPYTVYVTTESILEEKGDLMQGFTNAIYKGQKWVEEHTPQEVAEVIHPQFAETSVETLTKIIERYQEQDTWKTDPVFTEEALRLIEDILRAGGEYEGELAYDAIANTELAEKAMNP
mgnify:CR=1 FL=1